MYTYVCSKAHSYVYTYIIKALTSNIKKGWFTHSNNITIII